MKTSFKIYIFLTITLILWASAFVGIRAGLKVYSPGALALLRYFIASLAILPLYIIYRRKKENFTRADIVSLIILGILNFSIYNVALNTGEKLVDASLASFVIAQSPVLTVILARIFLKERLMLLGWVGLIVSIIGVLIIALTHHTSMRFQLSLLDILVAALCSSVACIMQKSLLKKMNGIEMTAVIIWIGVIPLFIFSPQLWRELHHATLFQTFPVIYLGIFPGALAYMFWALALKELPAVKAINSLYTMPILATFIGWLWLGEVPKLFAFIGGLIAFIGALMVHFSKVHLQQDQLKDQFTGERFPLPLSKDR